MGKLGYARQNITETKLCWNVTMKFWLCLFIMFMCSCITLQQLSCLTTMNTFSWISWLEGALDYSLKLGTRFQRTRVRFLDPTVIFVCKLVVFFSLNTLCVWGSRYGRSIYNLIMFIYSKTKYLQSMDTYFRQKKNAFDNNFQFDLFAFNTFAILVSLELRGLVSIRLSFWR